MSQQEPEYGSCDYCGFECNIHSQICGTCARLSTIGDYKSIEFRCTLKEPLRELSARLKKDEEDDEKDYKENTKDQ